MYTVNLENNTHFEIGRTYYYHFSCNYDSLSYMQIVSISDTRKTAMIQELIGGKPDGEPKRKKIYVYGGVEHISAGNYSMAGIWSADEWDKSELCKSLDLDFMYEHERAEALDILPELPAAAPAGTVYTVDVYFCKDYNSYGEKLRGVSLADMVKYVADNADVITDVLGEKWYLDFTLYKNDEYVCDSITGKTTGGDILDELSYKLSEKEYNAILAAISDPDKDPDPTEPTDKPDYSAFDENFNRANIISVSFGGASCSALTPVKRKKLTEKAWKKQLEAKAASEAAEKAAACKEIESRFEIGAKLSDGSIITEIETEEGITYITAKSETLNIWGFYDTECYDSEDFLNGVIAFEEIPEPEQPDENQITFDEITTYSANDTAENGAATASPIDETAAKMGHESYSFSDYKVGSATAAYNATVADVKAAADEVQGRIPKEYRGELDRLVNRYTVKLADWTNRKNRTDASCPSWFITGAAKYPHKKHERQMQRLDSLFKEYDQIKALEERIRNFAYEIKRRPIKAGDVNAADKLRAKVEELTALQNQMKQDNAEARKRGEPAPHAAWELSNNRQNLKRYADRLEALQRTKAVPTEQTEEIGVEGFRIVRNTEIMRLQFLFDSKPDERIRTLLKSNGFKWAPSQMAWQRQLTANAERAARTVTNAIQ